MITLKIKYADHKLRTRRRTLEEGVRDTDSIYECVRQLLREYRDLHRGVRLTGVSASDLFEGDPAPVLFPDEKRKKREALESLRADLEGRFGAGALRRGALVGPKDE